MKYIEDFLTEQGIKLNNRVDMPNGGIYLKNLLAKYEKRVLKKEYGKIANELIEKGKRL